MQLDGLTHRDIRESAAVLVGNSRDAFQLFRGEHASRNLDAHHEVAVVLTVFVNAMPLEKLRVVRIDRVVAFLAVAQDILPNAIAVLAFLISSTTFLGAGFLGAAGFFASGAADTFRPRK